MIGVGCWLRDKHEWIGSTHNDGTKDVKHRMCQYCSLVQERQGNKWVKFKKK